MGTNFSSLNCSKNKKGKKRKKKLSKATDRQRDSLESLHSTAARVLPKVSLNDQSLVEEKIRSIGNKHTHLQVRIERTRQQYEGVSANLSDIKAEVDKYLLWLTKQQQMMSEKVIAGKHLQSAEIRLENSKILCEELQSKEATIETVKGKVEELIGDLPHSERAFVDDWITQVCDQHQKVYSLAADHQKLLASSVEQRKKVHHKLQQICQWLQKKEREISKFHLLRLASQEVEKQLERCKALQNDVTGYKQQIDELQKRGKMLHIDCTADEMTEINSKLSEVDTRYAVLLNDISTCHNYLRDSVVSRRNFESDLLKNDKWCRETEMRCATEPVLDSAMELLEEQLVHYKSLQKTSKMFESLGKVIEETGISFKPKLVEEDKLSMGQQLKNAREQYNRCANLIQYRLQCIEAVISARSETEEKIREASNWIENIETELKKLSKKSGIDVTDEERVLEKFEAIGESLSIYQPTITQLNQESERLHNSGQSIDARRIVDITTKYELLQDQVTHQRKKIHKELVLLQQHQSQYEHIESLLSECKSNLEKVDNQEIGEKMKTLKMITDKFMEADTLFIQLDDKVQQLAVDNPNEDASPSRIKCHDLKDTAYFLKKIAEEKLNLCRYTQNLNEELESEIYESTTWLEQNDDALRTCGTLDLDTTMMTRTIHKFNMVSKEALQKVERLKEKAYFKTKHFTAEIPECMKEKLDQIDSLEKIMMNAVEKKKQYLATAETNRVQYENSMKQINEWLHGAEILTDSGYDTLDLETISCSLREHQDYFNEASMCQDEMEQVLELSERLLPSLDDNDTETLRQTLKQNTQRLNAVMAKSARKQELLETKINEWNAFQVAVAAVDEQLQMISEDLVKTENTLLVNQTSATVKDQLRHIKNTSQTMENLQLEVNDILEKAHELEKVVCHSSCMIISKMSCDINLKWKKLVTSVDVTEKTLSHILEQWEEFTSLEESLDKLLMEIKDSLPTVEGEDHSIPWLNNQLKNVKDLSIKLKSTHSKVECLKGCAQTLDNILPTAEARAECQKTFFNILENVKRLQNKIKETQRTLEEKIADRETFNKEELDENYLLNQSKLELLALDSGKTLLDDANTIKKQKALTTEKTPFQKNFDKISQKGKNPLGLDGMLSNQDHTDSNSSERISTEADYHYHEVCLSSPNLLMRNASIHHEEAFRQRKKGVSASEPDLFAVCEELPRERSASFDIKRISSAVRDTRLKQLRTSWTTLLIQVGAKEQQVQDAIRNQGQLLSAVQSVNTQLDRIQHSITAEFNSTESCIEDFQKSLSDFYDLKSEIVKLREQGMKLVDPSQPDSFKTMQSAFTMLNDRVENLQVFAEIRSTHIKTPQREVEVQVAAFEEIKAHVKHIDLGIDEEAGETIIKKPSVIHVLFTSLSEAIEKKNPDHEEILQLWHECKSELEKQILWLKNMRIFLSASIPCDYEELQLDYQKCMDIEGFQISDIQQRLLQDMEKKLCSVIKLDDFNVLNEQILLLNKHWHELNAQVSQRKIQIQNIMMQWTEFQNNVSGLHEWIDKMEYRILTDQEYHIEDLLSKFAKEYQDEILVKEKYKNTLLEDGQKLLKISKENQISNIQCRIEKTKDKWKHLSNTMIFRKRKLEETVLAVRQLDTSMANLRKWLSDIEHELSTPLYFMKTEEIEFKTKLGHQKDLQRDIEHHSLGVGSVLNLCEVLLHDSDACPSEVEFTDLQTAMKNLDRRWKHICQICPERSLWIKETWITLESLKEDCTFFENWLINIKLEIDSSASDQMNTNFSKEEIQHFEKIMKDIHGMYFKLEKINKVYKKLAREGRTDHMGTLKSTIFYCNKEWDLLQHRVSAILINLKQSAALDDDFKTMKNVIYKWLTDIDVRVTDLEHFSSMSNEAKTAEIKKIEKEIDSKERNVSSLDSYALLLMEKEDVANASKIQREVDELKNYMRAVSERAYLFSKDLKLKSTISSDIASDPPFEFEIYTDCSRLGSPQEKHIVGISAGGNHKAKDVLHQLDIMQDRVYERNSNFSQQEQGWTKFVTDVENTLSWLHDVVTDQNYVKTAFEKTYTLDMIIKHHRDFLVHLESKKTRIQSVNILGKDVIDLRTEEGRQLHDKLKEINCLWDKLCSKAAIQQRELQKALMKCQEFHCTIHDLLLWLEGVENKLQQCEPINLVMDETAMWSKLRTLSSLKVELESNKERIRGLKDTTDRLFTDTESENMMIAQDKMYVITNRHNALMKLCSSYMARVEDLLQVPITSIKRILDQM